MFIGIIMSINCYTRLLTEAVVLGLNSRLICGCLLEPVGCEMFKLFLLFLLCDAVGEWLPNYISQKHIYIIPGYLII